MTRNILSTAFKRYCHLEINISKTKTMIFNRQYINEEYPKKIVSIDNTPVKNTTVFKYLTCNISNIKHNEPSTGDSELEIHISIEQRKLYELGKKL